MQHSGINTVKGGKDDSSDDLDIEVEEAEEQPENKALTDDAVSEEDNSPQYFFAIFFKEEA